MKIILTDMNGKELFVDTNEIALIKQHAEEANHKGCGSLYMKASRGVFHIANAAEAIRRCSANLEEADDEAKTTKS